MNNDPIFIVGLGRSGTTLIRLMLNNHPNIAIPYESHFITDYLTDADTVPKFESESDISDIVSNVLNEPQLLSWDHTFEVNKIVKRLATPTTFAEIIDAIYLEYSEAKGKVRWGDKSDYLSRMHLIHILFPTAKFIHIVRDGRDVASSVIKLPWGPKDIRAAADWWSYHIHVARMVGTALGKDRYIEVRYEDLVERSENELRRLCRFINEDYSPEMLKYYMKANDSIPDARIDQHYNTDAPPKASRTYAWKREMRAIDRAIFQENASSALREFQYEIEETSVSGLRMKIAKIFLVLKRVVQ